MTQDWESVASVQDSAVIGQEIYRLVCQLYPICRSITGNGIRETLRILQEHIPLEIHEIPSGTPVFDWVVPKEWNIKDAYVKDFQGRKVVDFQKSNLHVLNYSIPVSTKVSLSELKQHLYTLPEHPDWIPYRTSYYKENWGFCLSHADMLKLADGEYEAVVDATLEDGHLTYGEYFLRGETDAEFLISTHVCHPSLANDNLSGLAVATFLAKHLSTSQLRYSYRFLFTPGTIGSIAWLSINEAYLSRIKHGLVLACLGDSGTITYKKTRCGNAEVDRAVRQVFKEAADACEIVEFTPYGYDERQFCSPGFNLPVGCFMRTPHGQFPEYHTSADNLDYVHSQYLADSFLKCSKILQLLEGNRVYLNRNPKCEPQLGKRGLYGNIGGEADKRSYELALLWVLNFSDGNHSLLDIAEKSNLIFEVIKEAADVLSKQTLLKESPKGSTGATG